MLRNHSATWAAHEGITGSPVFTDIWAYLRPRSSSELKRISGTKPHRGEMDTAASSQVKEGSVRCGLFISPVNTLLTINCFSDSSE